MLKDLGVKVRHHRSPERRQYFGETDPTVNKKALAAREAGRTTSSAWAKRWSSASLGITMEFDRPAGEACASRRTCQKLRKGKSSPMSRRNIGTGKTATAEQAAEVCTFIRTTVRHLYGARIARSITIQYGGSMKPSNAAELLGQSDIDGG